MTHLLRSLPRLTSIVLLLVHAPNFSDAQDSDEQIKQQLFKLEQALNTGVMTHDTNALKEILSSEYQLTGPAFPGGTARTQWIANSQKMSADSVTIKDVTISSWGEVAVFRSLQHFYNPVINGQPGPYNEAWLTDLWLKRNGRWQMVTRVSQRLPKK
jgi:uncharacterized protein DUF4440